MDKKQWHRQLIREIYEENLSMPFENRDLKLQAVYDEVGDHYLIMVFGVDRDKWKHYCIAHIDLVEDKIVIQHDSVGYSLAQELFDRGVPDEDMDQAFRIDLKEYNQLQAKWLEKQEKEQAKQLVRVS